MGQHQGQGVAGLGVDLERGVYFLRRGVHRVVSHSLGSRGRRRDAEAAKVGCQGSKQANTDMLLGHARRAHECVHTGPWCCRCSWRVAWDTGEGQSMRDARQHDSVTTPLHGGSAPGHCFAGGFTFLFFLRIGKRIVKKFRPLRNANHEAQTLTTARPPHPTTARGAGCPFIRLVRMYADRVKRRLRTVCSIHLSGESIWSLPFHTSLSI